jgi:uncharacterized protein (DUF433 family)
MSNLIYERIAIQDGAPVLRSLGVNVDMIIDMLSAGVSFDVILEDFEGVDSSDIEACLEYAYAK